MTKTAYVAVICHSQIGGELVNVLGALTAVDRGSQTEGVQASTQHLSIANSSKQHPAESEPAYAAVMRLSVSTGEDMYLRQWTKQCTHMKSDMQVRHARAFPRLSL